MLAIRISGGAGRENDFAADMNGLYQKIWCIMCRVHAELRYRLSGRMECPERGGIAIMKRRYAALFLAVLLTVSLTGCESVNEVANTVSSTVSEAAGGLTSTVSEKLDLSEETETEMAEGQRKATIQVVSITGNELTYIEETEEETESETEAQTKDETELETETGVETEAGTELGTGTEVETKIETDSGTESEVDTEVETDVGSMEESGSDSALSVEEMQDVGDSDMRELSGLSGSDEEGGTKEDTTEVDGESELETGANIENESEESVSEDGGSDRGGNMQSGQRGGMNMGGSDTDNSDMGGVDRSGLADAFGDGDIDMSSVADAMSSGGIDLSDVADTMSNGDIDLSSIADAMSSGDIDLSDIADVMSGDTALPDLVAETEDNSVTVYLQVGVVVYTTTGKEKTFSILQAGDEVKVLFETDADGNEVITKMWIVSTS